MNRFIWIAFCVFCLPVFSADLEMCKLEKGNILGAGIEGDWTLEESVSQSLYGGATYISECKISLKKDESVLALFGDLEKEGMCAYFAGNLELKWVKDGKERTMKSPVALTERDGNLILWHDERGYAGTGPIHDMHPAYLGFAKGVKEKRDLLFWGGDQVHEPMYALKRQ